MKYFGIGIILLAFVLFLTGCRVNKQLFKGNGLLKSEELNNFNTYNAYELEVNYINLSTGSIKIKFIEGEVPLIKVTTDEDILKTINLELKNNTIKIIGDKKYRYDVKEFTIEITQVKLNAYSLVGAFDIKDDYGNYDTSLKIDVNGVFSGDLNLENVTEKLSVSFDGVFSSDLKNLNLKTAVFTLNGTFNLEAEGEVENLDLYCNGVININFNKLVANTADITIDGTSSSSFNITEDLTLSVNGLGSVSYAGDPKKTNLSKNGLITVTKK